MKTLRKYQHMIHHPLVLGTLLLTGAGALSRIIGFFYRIFLTHLIGAEGLGIYQLIFPIYGLCFSLTAAGIQTAISKLVAEITNDSEHNRRRTYLFVGLLLSLSLSVCCSLILHYHSQFIAIHFIHEYRCARLLEVLAITLPFGSIHACINGYYYGKKKAAIPAISQLLEQIARVLSVYLLAQISLEKNIEITPIIAVYGIICGELISAIFSLSTLHYDRLKLPHIRQAFRSVSALAAPLTGTKVTLSLFGSMEAILIPLQLQAYGLDNSTALSLFGVLTGMALPLILFPTAITNSLSVILLPTISEASAEGSIHTIRQAVSKSIGYCLLFGFACTFFFLIFGKIIGTVLFASELCGTFIMQLSFICPFIYLTSTLSAILNGLGKTTHTFCYNLLNLAVRLLFVIIIIPIFGISGYLWGLLAGQILLACCLIFGLREYLFIPQIKA